MLAGRSAAEILCCHQNAGARVFRLIQNKIGIRRALSGFTPVIEEELAEAGALNPFQELFGDDLIGINVRAIERGDFAGMFFEWQHLI